MAQLRKAQSTEMADIIRVANTAFCPEREQGFDFQWVMPKAYKPGADTAKYHILAVEEGEIVALAGNLPGEVHVQNQIYPYAVVGTVSTLPSRQKKGYMKQVMQGIEQDDLFSGVVFSALGGLRKRYNRYGYEKCSTTYTFDVGEYCLREYPPLDSVTLRLADGSDLDALYALYQSQSPAIYRAKQSFFDCLAFSRSLVYVVEQNGEIVGYFNVSSRKNGIYEVVLKDYALLPHVFSAFFRIAECGSLNVSVSALNVPLILALDSFAESKSLCDGILIKVYDKKRFLQMLLSLNAPYLPQTAQEVICIDQTCYRITIDGDRCKVEEVALKNIPSYTAAQFVRWAISDGTNPLCKGSSIFPLRFGIDEADMF